MDLEEVPDLNKQPKPRSHPPLVTSTCHRVTYALIIISYSIKIFCYAKLKLFYASFDFLCLISYFFILIKKIFSLCDKNV